MQLKHQQFRADLTARLSSDTELKEQLLAAIENEQFEIGGVGLAWMPYEKKPTSIEPLF
jgi:hypothetical protein